MLATMPLTIGLHLMGLLPLRLPGVSATRLRTASDAGLNHGLTAFGAGLAFPLAVAPYATVQTVVSTSIRSALDRLQPVRCLEYLTE